LAGARGGRSEIRVRALLPDGRVARMRLGRDYLIDAELVERIAVIPGVVHHQFAQRPALALVG